MKRDALPLSDAALPAGTIRLSDLPPAQYTALRNALDAAARRERARVAAQWGKVAYRAVRRLVRPGGRRSMPVGPGHPRTEGCG